MKTNETKRTDSPNAGNGNAQNDEAQTTRENTNLSNDTPESDPTIRKDGKEPGKQAQTTDMPDENEKDII